MPIERPSRTSLLRDGPPQITDNYSIQWQSDTLACSGEWHPRFSFTLPPQRLFEDDTGSIRWQCHHPLAEARVRVGASEVVGLGYVELLEMTIPPWRLSIDELHWGRFLSESTYLVWIEWRGSNPLSLAFFNGVRIAGAQVSDTTITWQGGRLELNDRCVLRSGALSQTVLAKIPGAARIFPKSILDTDECKWRSRGTLSYEGTTHTGWAIHEVVVQG